jgi:dynein heavy chain
MDYLMVGKFFKGLAFSGAWCCFDEFNRINIEVLSVIAQQLLVLFSAKASLSNYFQTKEMEFEESTIIMRPTFNVYITMNPGYAGRSELPDNLAAQFRPVAMMVPDYALIGEIMLYAFGFTVARNMARKMVTTFKLSSEQLSSQDHYDYGMRAVKSTIEACGLLKRTLGDALEEDQIVLRALRDVNVPKFLNDDLPLFENIITDLFPDTVRPTVDYGNLYKALIDNCAPLKLQPMEWFLVKTIQLLDTLKVRHGMMLVGPTGGAKTANYRLLQRSMTELNKAGDAMYEKVQTHILNPKAITQAQLYGAFDEVTHEWSDGIASEQVRRAAADNKGGNPDNHWIVFDGPVDALWIESMNTVLDDNKKLCLVSGEIIALTPQMRMMFEVEDLAVASPATVSRCGMVYMEPEGLGLDCFVDSWIMAELPSGFYQPSSEKKVVTKTLDTVLKLCIPLIKVVRKKLKEVQFTVDNNLLQSLLRMLDCFFQDYHPTESKTPAPEEIEALEPLLGPLVIFCAVWTLGASCDLGSRKIIEEAIWEVVEKAGIKLPLEQSKHSLYDFCFTWLGVNGYDPESGKPAPGTWVPWMDTIETFAPPRTATFDTIVVPTNDSVRLTYVFSTLLIGKKFVLVPGSTGVGKTCYIAQWLQKDKPDNYMSLFINFSAQTNVNQLQDNIDSKLEKRRRGVFGPPAGKQLVLMVDDLNMPQKEYYGAQPPVEFMRQWIDHSGWYNRKELSFNLAIDMLFICAMGPPGGGRTFVTQRCLRHFNFLVATDLGEESVKKIFNTMTTFFLTPFEPTCSRSKPRSLPAVSPSTTASESSCCPHPPSRITCSTFATSGRCSRACAR